MADQLYSGQRFRLLTLVDNFTRESLAIRAGQRFTGDDVVAVLDEVTKERGKPQTIRVDNGPEYLSQAFVVWCAQHQVTLKYIQPGKPNQNAFVERFNDKFRTECLNANWFLGLEDAKAAIERWRREYNEERPHSGVGRIPPAVFARQAAALQSPPA